jgi:hypothetical protein
VDTWESFFREKSRRRSAVRNYRAYGRWTVVAIVFVALITVALVGLNAL